MHIQSSPPPQSVLHPVLRRHLLHLSHGPVLLRAMLRTDLPRWNALCEQRRRRCDLACRSDAEVQLFIGIQRSRLQHDNDRLLLGIFERATGALLDQISVRLQSARTCSAELHPFCQAPWHDIERLHDALRALCPFLFEQVGLRRLYIMVPEGAEGPLTGMLQALGFEREGLLRDHHFDGQAWQHRHLYALTAPAWRTSSELSP